VIAFEVSDMTCGHCVSTITKALKAADKDAKVQIDLATHRVQVEPAAADAAEFEEAIKDAGYTPVAVQAAAPAPAKPPGSCCGSCHWNAFNLPPRTSAANWHRRGRGAEVFAKSKAAAVKSLGVTLLKLESDPIGMVAPRTLPQAKGALGLR
jgi:copper chaperone